MAKYRVVGKMGTKGRRVVDAQGRPIDAKSRGRTARVASGSSYTIKSGDTLGAIAKRLGTTVSKLMAMNPQIKDANKIRAGAKLNIKGTPSGARSTAATRITMPTLLIKGKASKHKRGLSKRQEEIDARKKKTKARQAETRKSKADQTKGKRPFTPKEEGETTTALAGKSGPSISKRERYIGGKGSAKLKTGEPSGGKKPRKKGRSWRDYLRSLRR